MRRQGAHVHEDARSPIPSPSPSATLSVHEDYEDSKYHAASSNPLLPSPSPYASPSPPLLPLTLFLITTTACAISYYSTLEGGETEQWLHARLYGMAMWMVGSDVLFTLSILLALGMEGRWRRGALVYAITAVLCMFALDQGNTVQHHGAYNSLAFLVFLTPMMILSLVWRTCYFRFSCRNLMLINFGILTTMIVIFLSRVAYVKNDWNKGLLGYSFDNNGDYFCKVEPPSVNAMAILPYRAWNFWAGSHKCTPMIPRGKLDSDGLLTIENCNSNPQYALLPAVNNWPYTNKLYDTLQPTVLSFVQNSTFNYTKPVHVDAEAVLVECGTNRNVLIRSIEKPEVKERVTQYNKDNPVGEDRLNIVFLNFDAVARSHFHRRFLKSKEFITELHKSGDVEFFEFFRYHVLEAFTNPNLMAMYAGLSRHSDQIPTSPTIWDEFRELGYVSASIDNSCLDWSGKYQKSRTSTHDHQFVAPFCLPEVHPLHNPYGNFAGPFSILRRCLAGDYVHKYALEYLSQFITQYEGLPKFVIAGFNEGHEGTGEVIGLVDDDLEEFLEEVDYNNTALFIVSDHGLHMNIMFAFREQSVIKENALGLLTAIFPKWFLEKHKDIHQNLTHNRQALVTPFEIFETLRHMAHFPKKPEPREAHSRSIFEKIPYSRTCPEAEIPDVFCICNKDRV